MTRQSPDPEQPLFPGGLSRGGAKSTAVSHQTVRLTRGKHSSPGQGACVMELASMLAGEAFSDNPMSVCPVIGSFLRAYNDSIDDARRQDLYEYASKVVGSRASEAVERARTERLARWAAERKRRLWTRLPGRAARRWLGLDGNPPLPGAFAVRAIGRHTDESHAEALALIDELLALGAAEPAPAAVGAFLNEPAAAVARVAARDDAHIVARSDRERAAIARLRERHTVT